MIAMTWLVHRVLVYALCFLFWRLLTADINLGA